MFRLLKFWVDHSVVASFSTLGFHIRARLFDPADLAVDLRGRVALVTGANSGIGYATCEALARRGATVHMLCRDPGSGVRALDGLILATGNKNVLLHALDVSDLDSVRGFVTRWGKAPADILINNAGVLPASRSMTAQGFESSLATNLVGPYVLTEGLLPRLLASADARIIVVSSGGMILQRLDVAALEGRSEPFDGVAAYARAKRAQVVLGELWAKELEGTSVTVATMHPGWAETPAVRSSLPRFHRLTRRILRTAEQGADTVVWLAACNKVRGHSGLFWFDREPWPTHLFPWTREAPQDRDSLRQKLREWAGQASSAP